MFDTRLKTGLKSQRHLVHKATKVLASRVSKQSILNIEYKIQRRYGEDTVPSEIERYDIYKLHQKL